MAYTKNTWATDDIITAGKLNNLETGIVDSVDGVLITDSVDVNTLQSNGRYFGTGLFKNSPAPTTSWQWVIDVSKSVTFTSQRAIQFTGSSTNVFLRSLIGGTWQAWQKQASDSDVVKLTGDQTVAGNKSFTGNVSIAGSVMNYATIPNVSITGYVSGSLKVSKQSGMVSITSMDLVLAKGATLTLPAGYYPRAQLQAPITGQNTAGTTAGGYMTIGVDGSVTFNSMGFASGNATAYVNVHYIAQV